MKLEDIGFYTLSDKRARNVSATSPMMRCEMVLTDRCNFCCPYCRGVRKSCRGDMPVENAKRAIEIWCEDGLQNIRFSGGEPALYPHLNELVKFAKSRGVRRIALSTNGSYPEDLYQRLIDDGVDDFSISLDACCASGTDRMTGKEGHHDRITENIRKIASRVYVTTGIVLTDDNVADTSNIVRFAHDLGVADIRIISAAQYNKLLTAFISLEDDILDSHPILKYRVRHFIEGRNVRGVSENGCRKCHLVKDDSMIAGDYHFPCIIHFREGGDAIGKVGKNMRQERMEWFETHDSYLDPICRANCLDVCVDYNTKCDKICS
ncbi:MAG: radical SAM protein [Synergistaceae bacterium]